MLKDFKFEINRGDFICIKGHTGSGKSTIVSLIMRFNKLKTGSIKINNIDINKYKHDSFYKNINILGQLPFVFQDTIENNIKFGDIYSQENFEEVIEVAQLKEFVEQYSINHVINEDANNISGGQKQRISLARFLIRRPQILILDEPTAALDKTTANNFALALKDFAKKYEITLIVISHSPEFDNVATKIINL